MQGDWTDDTDQLLLILQMIVERKGTVEKCAFAEKMINWKMNGFKELNDVGRLCNLVYLANFHFHLCIMQEGWELE